MRKARRDRKPKPQKRRLWVHTVTTVSTFPRAGLFTAGAATIARTLASKRVSPKGITSGLRMLLFFINRAGRGLSAARRAELLKAKRLMQEMIARRRAARRRG
jgi:tRNA(adenine34) deaminase